MKSILYILIWGFPIGASLCVGCQIWDKIYHNEKVQEVVSETAKEAVNEIIENAFDLPDESVDIFKDKSHLQIDKEQLSY